MKRLDRVNFVAGNVDKPRMFPWCRALAILLLASAPTLVARAASLSDEINDFEYDANTDFDILTGDYLNAKVGAGLSRERTPDGRASIRREHYPLSLGINGTSLLGGAVNSLLPLDLGLSVERGVSFYRRLEPGLVKSSAVLPLNPLKHLPSSAEEIAGLVGPDGRYVAEPKLPPGTTLHLPARTSLSVGVGTRTAAIVAGAAIGPGSAVLEQVLSARLSRGFTVRYDTYLTRLLEPSTEARYQRVVSLDRQDLVTLKAGLRSDIDAKIAQGVDFGPVNAESLANKVLERVVNYVLGPGARYTPHEESRSVSTIFDYSYDLGDPAARSALNEALRGKPRLPELAALRTAVAKTGDPEALFQRFSVPFEASERLAYAAPGAPPRVRRNFAGALETVRTGDAAAFAVRAILERGHQESRANSRIVTHDGAYAMGEDVSSRVFAWSFGMGRERGRSTLQSPRATNSQGQGTDDYTELVFSHREEDKHLRPDDVTTLAQSLARQLGPEVFPWPPESSRLISPLSEAWRKLRDDVRSGTMKRGTLEFDFRFSPPHLSELRAALHREAAAAGGYDAFTGSKYVFLESLLLEQMHRSAIAAGRPELVLKPDSVTAKAKKGLHRLAYGSTQQWDSVQVCARQVAGLLAMFLMREDTSLAATERGLEPYRRTPAQDSQREGLEKIKRLYEAPSDDKCRETRESLTMPTLIALLRAKVPLSLGPEAPLPFSYTLRANGVGQEGIVYSPMPAQLGRVDTPILKEIEESQLNGRRGQNRDSALLEDSRLRGPRATVGRPGEIESPNYHHDGFEGYAKAIPVADDEIPVPAPVPKALPVAEPVAPIPLEIPGE